MPAPPAYIGADNVALGDALGRAALNGAPEGSLVILLDTAGDTRDQRPDRHGRNHTEGSGTADLPLHPPARGDGDCCPGPDAVGHDGRGGGGL